MDDVNLPFLHGTVYVAVIDVPCRERSTAGPVAGVRPESECDVDIYTIIFLALAVFIFLRLRNVLGQRTGNERPPL